MAPNGEVEARRGPSMPISKSGPFARQTPMYVGKHNMSSAAARPRRKKDVRGMRGRGIKARGGGHGRWIRDGEQTAKKLRLKICPTDRDWLRLGATFLLQKLP